MKRLVSAILLSFVVLNAIGQIGHEWIQFHQQYFKISVGQDGLYRLSYDHLRQAGFDASADPRTFQIFHRGKEQAIIVEGENDGVFHPGDYIEFFGRKNDGASDSTLYELPEYQPHRLYNLYSDTTAYFLTSGSGNGKRISLSTASSSGLSEETFHWAEKILVLREHYSAGRDYGDVLKTVFDLGEGWTGVQVVHGQEISYSLDGISAAVAGFSKPQVEVLLTGRGPMPHAVELYVGSRLLSNVSFNGFESHKHVQEIEWSDIDGTGKLVIKLRVTGAGGADRVSAGYVRLLFPQQLTMASVPERMFGLEEKTGNVSFLKIQNPPAGLRLFDVTDASTVVQLQGEMTATYDAVVPGTSVARKIFGTAQVLSPARVKKVIFRSIQPALTDYILITHASLRKPALGYLDPVKAFAEYRALPEGGGFDTLIMNIDQLYDQFNYGETSPRAIFQFMKFLAGVKLPDYLFLIGKGLDVYYAYARNPGPFTVYKDLIPSAGFPASDMFYTAGLGNVPGVPAVATGRLSANSPLHVAAYLNKVKERDALPFEDLNRKKILHLSGGIEENEPVMFSNILKNFELVAENVYLGGHVQAIVKRSTDIKLINIAEEVNSGLGLITFFGHSAPNTLDFDIGLVTDPIMGYNNPGKYPLLLMNGCNAGSFFLNTAIMGENWINTPHKGAVGFIAHSSYGLLSGLQRYSSAFYDVAFGDSVFVKKGVGNVQQELARRFLDQFGSSPVSLSQVQQMVLLGDPALPIFGAQKPDYAPDEERISITSFNGEPVSALSDSFKIQIPVRNYGLATDENFRILITRKFNGDNVVEYDTIIRSVLYADTVAMVIRNNNGNGYGINSFSVTVDADNLIGELNESNNIAEFEYFIPLNGTRNLYPYNYSIVNVREVNLSFQYTDPLAGERDYILEIDTTRTFDSGYKQQFLLTTDILARHPITLLDRDSLVYYWRTRIAQPLEHESKSWNLSSFTFIHEGGEGWAQLDFPQFLDNEVNGLVKDPQMRKIQFQETVSELAIKTFSSNSGKPQDSVSFRINGVEFNLMNQGAACRNNTINFIAFDRRSTQPYAGIYLKWYEIGGRTLVCGREPYVINSFLPEELITGSANDLVQYVDNIAAGDSVVLFNIGNAGYEQWPAGAISKLAELGISSDQLSGLTNGDPVVIFGRKGSPSGAAKVFHAPSPESFLHVNKTIEGRFTSGTMSSPVIGPAQRWDRFIPRLKEVEGVDEASFDLIGIRTDGTQDTLKTQIDRNEDLSFVNANIHPYIKIAFHSGDDINLTSVQLANWLVLYEPVAEGLVFFKGQTLAQKVHEGENVSRDFGFVNISNKSFSDSLAVRFELLNARTSAGSPSWMKISPPPPGDTTLFTVPLSTISKGGLNDVEVFVNPRIVPENTFDNNLIVLRQHLDVIVDHSRPVIDVTFDGRYLQNDEFVSPNPLIRIALWDENTFMLKEDTLGLRIFLSYPCGSEDCAFEPIHFSSEAVRWNAATDTSDFEVYFSPSNLSDGQYVLSVEARDASGNESSDVPYEIRFRVQHEKTVTVTRAYPNPFLLATTIDVTVTGEENIPARYWLYVVNVNGSVVAESVSESNILHIGTNRIQWNGSGNDGKSLPNGIYFYRLLITGAGKDTEYNGKVVIAR